MCWEPLDGIKGSDGIRAYNGSKQLEQLGVEDVVSLFSFKTWPPKTKRV